MTFGKHKGKTVQTVLKADPGYFTNLASWKNNVFDERPDLKAALEKEGVLERLLGERPQVP